MLRLLRDRDPRELWERATTMCSDCCDVLRRGWGEIKSLVRGGERKSGCQHGCYKGLPMDVHNSMIVRSQGSSGFPSM